MEEKREQPIIMPATALNRADERSAMSEIGSLHDLGKFKTVQALKDAYDSLQVEFTKKCQKLSQLQKDKTEDLTNQRGEKAISEVNKNQEDLSQNEDNLIENDENINKNEENFVKNQEIDLINQKSLKEKKSDNIEIEAENSNDNSLDEEMAKFLESNFDASSYADEIKQRFQSVNIKNSDPFAVAWAEVLISHIKEGDKLSDPIINQYVLSDENVRKKIVEDYLVQLNKSKPPIVISSQSGERLSGVMPDSPKTLDDAKRLVGKMFS